MDDPSSGNNNQKESEMRRDSFQRDVRSLSFPSPTLSSLGVDENESESNRYSAKAENQSKQSPAKNFMSPTISTASKSLSLKKKILAEWTDPSPDADLKKPLNLGPKTISPKVDTSNSSTKTTQPKIPSLSSPNFSSKFDDVNVGDETFVPDPSTKPYDPLTNYLSPRPKFLRYNPNRRRKAILPRKSVSSSSQSTSVYSTAESSTNPESGGTNGQYENQEVQVENEEEEMEETVVGERKCGLKWVFLKSLIMLAILVLSTMYISSMNLPEPPLDVKGLEVEYQELGNNTFRSVSLRSIELMSWVSDVREESNMGMTAINEIVVASKTGDAIEDQKIEGIAEKIVFLEDYYQNLPWFDSESGTKPILKSLEDNKADDDPNLSTKEVDLISDSMSNEEFWTDNDEPNEVEFDAESPYQGIEESQDVQSDNQVQIVSEDLHKIVLENEVEINERIEVGILSESEPYDKEDSKVEENKLGQLWWNPKNVVWGVIPSLITWGAALIVKFYLKCKKASTKTSSSNVVKLSIEVEKSTRLPPKATERITHKLNPPSGGAHSREEKLDKGSSRVIPNVKMLGEFVVGGEFRRRSFDLQSEQKIHSFRRTFSPAKDGKEVNNKMSGTSTTPLRRSSRLRNKSVTSP